MLQGRAEGYAGIDLPQVVAQMFFCINQDCATECTGFSKAPARAYSPTAGRKAYAVFEDSKLYSHPPGHWSPLVGQKCHRTVSEVPPVQCHKHSAVQPLAALTFVDELQVLLIASGTEFQHHWSEQHLLLAEPVASASLRADEKYLQDEDAFFTKCSQVSTAYTMHIVHHQRNIFAE